MLRSWKGNGEKLRKKDLSFEQIGCTRIDSVQVIVLAE
jgi:hypothetical protein